MPRPPHAQLCMHMVLLLAALLHAQLPAAAAAARARAHAARTLDNIDAHAYGPAAIRIPRAAAAAAAAATGHHRPDSIVDNIHGVHGQAANDENLEYNPLAGLPALPTVHHSFGSCLVGPVAAPSLACVFPVDSTSALQRDYARITHAWPIQVSLGTHVAIQRDATGDPLG